MSWITRFWERVRGVYHPEPQPDPAAELIHFSIDHYGYPLCNARVGAKWAMNLEAVTCRACREAAMPYYIQYWCNTR